MKDDLTHFDAAGRPKMVDVGQKPVSARKAIAEGRVIFGPETYALVKTGGSTKGDIRRIAELAGIMGAKRTSDLIPLCHPLPICGVHVQIDPDDTSSAFIVRAEVKTAGQTGVEMEALTAVSTACLTIYDMAKAADKSIRIDGIRLIHKSGGKSGTYDRADD